MKVQLLLTCLCDALYGEVGIATVQVLEHCGVEVMFPQGQTCCGQPAFNSGDWEAASRLLLRVEELFDPRLPVIVPSASCAAMLRHGAQLMRQSDKADQSTRTREHRYFELSEFLIDELGISSWPSLPTHRSVVFHQSCHGRMIRLGGRQKQLLGLISNLTVLEPECPEQCCGFGGSFAAKQPHLSQSIGSAKLEAVGNLRASELVSGDMGCLMHLATLGLALGQPIRTRHYVELLAEAIQPNRHNLGCTPTSRMSGGRNE